jgi:hypothetical protein
MPSLRENAVTTTEVVCVPTRTGVVGIARAVTDGPEVYPGLSPSPFRGPPRCPRRELSRTLLGEAMLHEQSILIFYTQSET